MSADLQTVLDAISAGDHDAYALAVSAGQALASATDAGRWQLALLAEAIPKEYGRDALGSFAKDIGVNAGTLREYRRVHKIAQAVGGDTFLTDYPTLTYSHWRVAARVGKDRAASFVEWMASEGATADAAAVEAKRLKGRRVSAAKLLDIEVDQWEAVHGGRGLVIIHTGLLEVDELPEKIRVVIYGV